MSKFRKKPVVIEAFRWTGDKDQVEEEPDWFCKAIEDGDAWFVNGGTTDRKICIKTLEGNHHANRGDFIIRGVKGEIYPIKASIFQETYEPVDEATS